MSLPKEKIYTIKDIYALPEEKRAELIDGQIYYMAPPTRIHQKIISKLNQLIANYIERNNGQCEVYPSPFAVFLEENSNTYVEPDISVICDLEKLNEKGCKGAPDWIIEVVSPSSKKMDYYTKLFKYRNTGVREYWIVDPDKNKILVYNLEKEDGGEYTFSDKIEVGIYKDFCIDFSKVL